MSYKFSYFVVIGCKAGDAPDKVIISGYSIRDSINDQINATIKPPNSDLKKIRMLSSKYLPQTSEQHLSNGHNLAIILLNLYLPRRDVELYIH